MLWSMPIALADISAFAYWRTHDRNENQRLLPHRRGTLTLGSPTRAAIDELGSFGINCDPSDIHILVSGQGAIRHLKHVTCHVISDLPAASLVQAAPGIYVATPEMTLAQMARHQSLVDTLSLSYELCGTYRVVPDSLDPAYCSDPVTSLRSIQRFCTRAAHIRGTKALSRAACYLCDGSASPAETALSIMLCLPRQRGGYGLPKPLLNCTLELNEVATRTAGCSTIRPDFLWPGTAAEYDGRMYHSSTEQSEYDERRRTTYGHMGMSVVVFGTRHLQNTAALDDQVDLLRRSLGIERPSRLPSGYAQKHEALASSLFAYWRKWHFKNLAETTRLENAL